MDHETKEMFELLLSEIKGTRADVAELKVEIDDVKVRLTNVEDRLTNVENRLTNVENRLTNVEDRLTNVEIDLAETKEMHVETLRLCKALMHGNELLQAQQDAMQQDIAQLQGRQKQYDAAILMLNDPA